MYSIIMKAIWLARPVAWSFLNHPHQRHAHGADPWFAEAQQQPRPAHRV